jgi:predicted TIM-barrel fold metal-dependent hydrolase
MTRRDTPLIDTDVHPSITRGKNFIGLLEPYLESSRYRRLLSKTQASGYSLVPKIRYALEFDVDITDASEPRTVCEDLLDQHGIDAALLVPLIFDAIPFVPFIDDAVDLMSAFNDYFAEEWLSYDERLKMTIGVDPRDPAAAAREIARSGGREGVVGVMMAPSDILWGGRYYDPVFAAAEEHGLPIVAHLGNQEGEFPHSPKLPGGEPAFAAQRISMFSTVAMAHIASLVFEGAIMRFPRLKFAFLEYGFSWLPSLMWKLDSKWKEFRADTPWVKRPPSEYILESVRFSTQPLDEPRDRRHLEQVFEMVEADRTLMFSTDYPHWDVDYPERALSLIPADVRSRVCWENAVETFGRLRLPAAAGPAAG